MADRVEMPLVFGGKHKAQLALLWLSDLINNPQPAIVQRISIGKHKCAGDALERLIKLSVR